MSEEKNEIESSDEDEKIESEEESEKESEDTEEKKSEEEESQKDDFEKDSEVVPVGKYNQAIRKLREKELEERELRKQIAEKPAKKEEKKEEDEEDEDFFDKEDEKSKDLDIDSIVDKKVKPILERLTKQEQDDKRKQRDAFFKAHPKYLNDSKEWQALLDEMDESINPNKGTYYEQLSKAHRILSGGTSYNKDVESKKNEMAAEIGSNDKGSKKSDPKSSVDDRADRLAKNMPIGYTYTGK